MKYVTGSKGGSGSRWSDRRRQRREELANTSLWDGLRRSRVVTGLVVTGLALVVVWLPVIVDSIAGDWFTRFGIRPRQVAGLSGVLLAPVVHSGPGQLAGLSLPLAAFIWLLAMGTLRDAVICSVIVIVISGAVSWLTGPASGLLLGSSGLLFGWFGYLIARAWFSRKVRWIAGAILVLALFTYMFSALMPTSASNSGYWPGRASGFVAGVWAAWLLHSRRRKAGKPRSTLPSTVNPPQSVPPSGDLPGLPEAT